MRETFRPFLMLTVLCGLSACGVQQLVESDLRACQTQRVKDGDSVLAVCGGVPVELRLACVDAPERTQKRYGALSKKALQASIGERFSAHFEGEDRYGRTIATLWRGADNLNLGLVETGNAVVYRQYCEESEYLLAEQRAKQRQLGVWDGVLPFVLPWEWRRR